MDYINKMIHAGELQEKEKKDRDESSSQTKSPLIKRHIAYCNILFTLKNFIAEFEKDGTQKIMKDRQAKRKMIFRIIQKT